MLLPPARWLIPLAVAAGCSGGNPPAAPDAGGKADDPESSASTCAGFTQPLEVGELDSKAASEISGLVRSRSIPGLLWAHNDGDEAAELLAINRSGELVARLSLPGSEPSDLEDIAMGPGPEPERSYLYLADIGDNQLERDTVAILRLPEPALDTRLDELDERTLDSFEVFELRYSDGRSHDAEAVVVEPESGDVYVFTKANRDDEHTRLFRASAPLAAATELEMIASDKDLPALRGSVVAADISADGSRLAVGFKNESYRLWRRRGENLSQVMSGPFCATPRIEGQNEALALTEDGTGMYLVPEGKDPHVYFLRERVRCPQFLDPAPLFAIDAPSAVEISGAVVASSGERLWAINDPGAGERTVLYGVDLDGPTEVLEVPGAENENWEDIALGPGPEPGTPYLYIADTGDNQLERDQVRLYRFPEPAPGESIAASSVEVLVIEYPGGDAHDAEALAIDPSTGDGLLITRRRGDDERTRVYELPELSTARDEVKVDKRIDERDAPALDATIVAADVSLGGDVVGLGTRAGAPQLFSRHPEESLWEVFMHPSCEAPHAAGKHDSLALDGWSYWLIPEGDAPPVLRVEATQP